MIEIRPSATYHRAPNITPLVDIVFLLLIFFMLTAFFIQPEGMGVDLPDADAPPTEAVTEFTVLVDETGDIEFNGVPMSKALLESELSLALEKEPAAAVVVKADGSLPLQGIVGVMEAINRAGAERLVIATERPEQ